MRNGIKKAVQAGFTHIQIEGDNKILIQAVQGYIQPYEKFKYSCKIYYLTLNYVTRLLFIIFLERIIAELIG